MTEGTDTPNPTLGTQRKLALRVAITGGPDHVSEYDDASRVIEAAFRIPDDLDLATLDQVGAKITKATAGIVDEAIVATGRHTIHGILSTLVARSRASADQGEDRDAPEPEPAAPTEDREFVEV